MSWLRNFVAPSLLAVLIAGPASAGEWTGVYAGLSVGGAWSKVDWAYFNDPTQTVTRKPSGVIGGAQFGAQFQWQHFVIGAELGYLQGNARDQGLDAPAFAANYDSRARLTDVLTLGPRIGYVFNHNLMAYVTGGYANATVETGFILRSNVAGNDLTSNRHDGSFIGGGLEYALTKNWIIGAEFKHLRLTGSFDHLPPITDVSRFVSPVSADIAQARLTFKFGP
jgi:outer membrane immunogenic protein